MSNDMTVPTWEQIREVANEVDQMAVQSVQRACDLGDMLRAVRLTMDAESFVQAIEQNLRRGKVWAYSMITLSFRRHEALTCDNPTAAYEEVKRLPAPEEETMERKQWPKAKPGPRKGSGGRPKAEAVVAAPEQPPPPPTVKAFGVMDWLRERGGIDKPGKESKAIIEWIKERGLSTAVDKLDELDASVLQAASEVAPAVTASYLEWATRAQDEATQSFAVTAKVADPVRTVKQLEERLTALIHGRLLVEAQQAVLQMKAKLEAEYREKEKQLAKEWYDKRDSLNGTIEAVNRRMQGANFFMSKAEYQLLMMALHADKYEANNLDAKQVERLNKAFHIVQRMRDTVDPMTPIALLRQQGWEDAAPAYKRRNGAAANRGDRA